MGILTKNVDKKAVSVMVRIPSSLKVVMDLAVGNSHSSRPDFVIDGIRSFLHYVVNEEAGIMIYLQERKNVEYDVRKQFYYEAIRSRTETYRNGVFSAQEISGKGVVDVLLSLPRGLVAEIDRTVERTKCFRNHQEFIKSAIIYKITQMGADNTNIMLTENFFVSNDATKEMREQIEQMKRESKYSTDAPTPMDMSDMIKRANTISSQNNEEE